MKFAQNEDGELVHLILIWMNEEGKPVGLVAANRCGTGDKYVNGKVLKELTENFFIEPSLHSDPRVVEFVKNIFWSYNREIQQLYDERDNWITDFVSKYYREPVEDRDNEILSFKEIKL